MRCSLKNIFLKIEDKVSSKNLSPEIVVYYCITGQVSINNGNLADGKITEIIP